MADDRRLLPQLVAADRTLQDVQLPAPAVRRIADRITGELERAGRARRFAWIPMLTFVAGAALVLSFLAERRIVADAAVASRDQSVRIAGDDCHPSVREGGALALAGACVLAATSPAMRIHTVAGAELDVDDRIVHLQRGSAVFDVDPVVGEPLRVVVPGGTIVVVGTRFRVDVDGAGGQVDLFEGALEFYRDDGSVAPIAAGEQFAFGEPVRSEPPPQIHASASPRPPAIAPPPAVTRATKRRPSVHAGTIVDEVQQLRRSGDYERAAKRLRDALEGRWPRRTAEVLSYELGTILARHLGDAAGACAHWQQHLRRFGQSRYRRQIEASRVALACP